MPTELDVIQRKIISTRSKEAALKKETDTSPPGTPGGDQKELSGMREEFKAKAQWDNERRHRRGQ